MKELLLKNWKTTLVGLFGAVPQLYQYYETGGKSMLITGIATILLGLLAKDYDKSHTQPN